VDAVEDADRDDRRRALRRDVVKPSPHLHDGAA
jgi:hypothetical protein